MAEKPNNPDNLFVYVKGFKGQVTYRIYDNSQGEILPEDRLMNLTYSNGAELDNTFADIHGINQAFEYIVNNTGQSKIPKNPIINFFSSYESNVRHINKRNTIKSEKIKEYIDEFTKLENKLSHISGNKKNNQIKIRCIQNNVSPIMDSLIKKSGDFIGPKDP